MTKWEEFKDGRTPFGNLILMEGFGEGWYTKSLTMSSLFAFEMLFNSTTCNCISGSLSCLIFSLSSNSFLSFSSLAFLRLSSFAFAHLFSFSQHEASQVFLLLFAYQALETFQASLVLAFIFLSLFFHSRASPNCS